MALRERLPGSLRTVMSMDVPCGKVARHRVVGGLLLALLLLGCAGGAWSTAAAAQRSGHVVDGAPVAWAHGGASHSAQHMCASAEGRCTAARAEPVPYAHAPVTEEAVVFRPPLAPARLAAGSPWAPGPPCGGGRFALCVIRT
ncbi:hypothetical protein [Streptomyces gobiensis]|uniref:hypothetical protein n=1 Tax=Streptomyces gobiensis TaxID=2875706 RepID=UPI001E31498C|nr:hypothetical protein [Streptomyces gobiensis]UGY90998.1 hypothetical protein test1122_04165 [Streptomyces gobiensis]